MTILQNNQKKCVNNNVISQKKHYFCKTSNYRKNKSIKQRNSIDAKTSATVIAGNIYSISEK